MVVVIIAVIVVVVIIAVIVVVVIIAVVVVVIAVEVIDVGVDDSHTLVFRVILLAVGTEFGTQGNGQQSSKEEKLDNPASHDLSQFTDLQEKSDKLTNCLNGIISGKNLMGTQKIYSVGGIECVPLGVHQARKISQINFFQARNFRFGSGCSTGLRILEIH